MRSPRPPRHHRKIVAPIFAIAIALLAASAIAVPAGRAGTGPVSGAAATAKLGVTYGPFLGKRCRDVAYPRCELIGIDVVLGRAASRVFAVAGDQRIRLRTPGEHNGIPRHDWVGTFTATNLARDHHSANRAGQLLRVPVWIQVEFAGGDHARARFPRVQVTPGWG